MEKRIRTRFAPSPTGFLHIGGVRSALYPELLAHQKKGDFVLRIEDTDRSRFVPGAMESLCRTLDRLGIIPNEGVWIDENETIVQRGDHGPYIQSERADLHRSYAKKLVEMGKAYYCFCTPERLEEVKKTQRLLKQISGYDGHCRVLDPEEAEKRVQAGEVHVIRLKLPKEGSITIPDVIRGDVRIEWRQMDDQVVLKSDGMATYHLASTVDDHDMEITHVIRGEEWLSSAPKHFFIYEAFGWEMPIFAHLPLILNPDKSKLSKRQGDVSAESYLEKGYLPDALVNFIALMGWNPSGDREIYTHQELMDAFNLSKINKAGAVFNLEKLDWLNNHYLQQINEDAYLLHVLPFLPEHPDTELKKRVALLYRPRAGRLTDLAEETLFLLNDPSQDPSVSRTWKTQSAEEAVVRLVACKGLISELSDTEQYQLKKIEEHFQKLIRESDWKNGEVLWPLRVALSGKARSPGPYELLAVLGREESIKRIDRAIAQLQLPA